MISLQTAQGMVRAAVHILTVTMPLFAFAEPPDTEPLDAKITNERLSGLMPNVNRWIELDPGRIRLIGFSGPERGRLTVQHGQHSDIRLFFMVLPGATVWQEQDIIFTIDGIDIGRHRLQQPAIQPGEVFTESFELRVPSMVGRGSHWLTCGFVKPETPGEFRQQMPESMAPLTHLQIETSKDALDLEARRDWSPARTLISNGGFEDGFKNWEVDYTVQHGLGGWSRALSTKIDTSVSWESKNSLRVNFAGGQDINFFHIKQAFAVKPDSLYKLKYQVRTEDVTSNSGPYISVTLRSGKAGRPSVFAPDAKRRPLGTTDWHEIEVPFRTGTLDSEAVIRIRRDGSGLERYLPSQFGPIGGTVWFDAVECSLIDSRP